MVGQEIKQKEVVLQGRM